MPTRSQLKTEARAILREKYTAAMLPCLVYAVISAILSATGLGSLLTLPLSVGLSLVYLQLYRRYIPTPSLELMFTSVLQEQFLTKLLGMLLVGLYSLLWSFLFVIPGIVKGYSYAATSYLLAEYPRLGANDAITLSRRVMDGHKMDLFVLQLSFIGWSLLGLLTFGILNLFYVSPYIHLTQAGAIDSYIKDAIAAGKIDYSDLRVDPPYAQA